MKEKQPRVFALGFFDGVHCGHRRILAETVSLARGLKGTCGMLTFDRRPKNVAKGETAPILTSPTVRRGLALEAFPNLEIREIRFTEDLAAMSWQDFAKSVLIQNLGITHAVVGTDFRFGKGGEGNPVLLATVLPTKVVEPVMAEGEPISSTKIRALLTEGELDRANHLLGAPFTFVGNVQAGDGRGTSLGFPTLNIPIEPGTVKPKRGVYLSACRIGGQLYYGLTNMGTRPTFYPDGAYGSETALFTYAPCVEGPVWLSLLAFLRPEQCFPSREDLIAAMEADRVRGLAMLEKGNLPVPPAIVTAEK